MYKSYMKNAMYLTVEVKLHFTSAILSLGKHCLLPIFVNVIKNKITS